MRERTPLAREVLERLPRLRMIASTGPANAAIDMRVTEARGIEVAHTGYSSNPTIELTWAVILALARHVVEEVDSVRGGGWQRGLGTGLSGKTLGVLGLGRIGSEVARIGRAFGMEVIAWSQNLTPEDAATRGATRVAKAELFERSDFLSIHTVLSKRTRGLVDAEMIAKMKPSAYLVNMSRGPIVDEAALIAALTEGRIAGGGHRCVRRGAAAARSSLPPAGERGGDSAHGVCDRGDVPDVLRRLCAEHRGLDGWAPGGLRADSERRLRSTLNLWRRVGDSNPRYRFPRTTV